MCVCVGVGGCFLVPMLLNLSLSLRDRKASRMFVGFPLRFKVCVCVCVCVFVHACLCTGK